MSRGDFVAGDRVRGPCLDGAKGTSFDTGHLHVTRNRIASHAEMMLESRFRGVLDDARFSIERGSNQCRGHRRRYADLGLAAALSR